MKDILLYIVGILGPNNRNAIWISLINDERENGMHIYDRDNEMIMEVISDAYSNAHHWPTRRQFLSIVAANVLFQMMREYVLDLTLWKFNEVCP